MIDKFCDHCGSIIVDKTTIGDLIIDKSKRRITNSKKEEIELGDVPFRIFQFLVQYQENVVSYSFLIKNIWDKKFDSDTINLLQVHIFKLRKILTEYSKNVRILTIKKRGYSLITLT